MMTSALSDALAGRTRIAFDTNAVIYYLEGTYPYGVYAAQAFSLLASGAAVGFVSTMVEMETLVRPLRIRDRGLLFSIRRFFALHPNLYVTPMSSDIAQAAAQVRASTNLKAPDAIIAATAAANRCDVIIGNDRAFARNSELPYLVLDDFAV